jgi:hypothetical protein
MAQCRPPRGAVAHAGGVERRREAPSARRGRPGTRPAAAAAAAAAARPGPPASERRGPKAAAAAAARACGAAYSFP